MRPAGLAAFLAVVALASAAASATPSVGGTCLPCGQLDHGPFTSSVAWQTHAGRLDSAIDCAWYGITVRAGTTYEFGTCSPGSAEFDTVIDLFSDGCVFRTSDDDDCPPRSRIVWVSPETGLVRLKVRGFGGDFGAYELAWREVGGPCATCTEADAGAPLTPSASCSSRQGVPDACLGGWQAFTLTAEREYEFATCGLGACGGYADADVQLGLFDPSCRLVARDRDSCGTGLPLLRYRVPRGAGGLYRVRVQAETRQSGLWRLTYREGPGNCAAPAFVSIEPMQATAELASCARTQTVLLSCGAGATPPVTHAWRVTPPAGGSAVPAQGSVTSAVTGGAASFNVRLSGLGAHRIEVVALNACGSASAAQDLLLTDVTPPRVLPPPSRTVECPGPPPPEQPQVLENCDRAPFVTLSESTRQGACPAEHVLRREWVASDASGNTSAPAWQVIVVRDTTPPVITPDASVRWCAYPPDHGRACFGQADFAPVVTDACAGSATWRFTRVTHDESSLGACDPPDAEPDVELSPDGTLICVRAERCIDSPGVSPGRAYLVEAIAVDACGNVSAPVPIGVVLVPQDGTDTSACAVPQPW